MILYEVNVSVKSEIEKEYRAWLKTHIAEMLELPGFIRAETYEPTEKTPDKIEITMHYFLDSIENMENYLKNHAPRMREDGVNRFKNQFSATRRILKLLK